MKCRLPLDVIFLNCSVPNSGLLRSVNDTAIWTTTKFYFTGRTVVGTNARARLDSDWEQA
jgi:hypothetical protein